MIKKVTDVTGVELSVGTVVSWCIGGRYNSGFAIGKIERFEEKEEMLRSYDRTTKSFSETPYTRTVVHMTSLMSSRKSRTNTVRDDGSIEVIALANQDYSGNK
ncbi:hypothetical protein [uncultured Cohaesibacter sp.]|uniref:hypothetical protein n=1 Tax=uncultured Cohaesibacter sp. TaxID=1002546 RepID=UPI0029C7E825|nr:hypothetical protein [uncultured Cohaesibacter sp.]